MGVILAAVVSCGLQEAAGRPEDPGFVYTLPRDWTRSVDAASKITVLTPPGAGQDASMLLYPTTPNVPGTAQEAHDAMVKSITGAAKVEGEPQTGTTGTFRWTRLKIAPAGGPTMRIALYTAKSGTTACTVAFAASSDELFRKHLPDVEALVKGLRFAGAADPADPAPAGAQAIHGLLIPLPPGWTRKDDPKGSVALTPPPPRGALEAYWDYVIYVLPPQPLQGTPWETHKALFQEALKASGLKNPVTPTHRADEPGPFIRSVSAGHDAAGRVREISMYSALSEGHIECLLIHNQEDRDGLRPILAKTTVKVPPRNAGQRPKIVEAYRRGDQKLYVNPSGGAPAPGSLQYERIWLRADGVADFTTVYPEGHAASPVVLKLDPGFLNGSIGSWKARGDARVEIVRTAGVPAEVYERDNGRLRLGDQLWQPMPPVDGLRLDGRWSVKSASGGIGIEFTKEGGFKDDGVAAHVASPDGGRPKPPRQGAGTYELREWTLFLKYDDGTSWSTDCSTIGPDPKDLSSILLKTHAFRKE